MSEWRVPIKLDKITVFRTLTMAGGSNPDNQKTTTHKLTPVEMSIEEFNSTFKPKRKLNWFDKILFFRK